MLLGASASFLGGEPGLPARVGEAGEEIGRAQGVAQPRVVLPASEHGAQPGRHHVHVEDRAVAARDSFRRVLGDGVQGLRHGRGLRLGQGVRGERVGAVHRRRAEIHEAFHAGCSRRVEHVHRALYVGRDDTRRIPPLALDARGDDRRVDGPRRAALAKRSAHRGAVDHIALHVAQRSRQRGERVQRPPGRRREAEGHHVLATPEQALEQIQADEAGASGEEDAHGSRWSATSRWMRHRRLSLMPSFSSASTVSSRYSAPEPFSPQASAM